MRDDRTPYLNLPLPNQGNTLSEDLPRLRQAFSMLDENAAGMPSAATQAEVTAGLNAVKYVSPLTLSGARIKAAQIDGVLDVSHVPSAAMQDLVDVLNDAERFALTAAVPGVHLGASVRVLQNAQGTPYDPPKLYIIHDMDNLSSEAGYREYSIVVQWEDIKGKPLGDTPTEGNLVVYGEGGTVPVAAPIAPTDATTKAYVDTAFLDYFLGWKIFKGIHPVAKPGMVPVKGTLLANAATLYPKAWAYLQSAEGQALCTTEALWQAASIAKWATLADGTQIGWDGIGGVCKYVIDLNAGTIRVPDLRGMYEEMDGYDSLGVGGVHGDGSRRVQGAWSDAAYVLPKDTSGCITAINNSGSGNYTSPISTSLSTKLLDTARVVPVANKNQPRAYGVLGCVYLGLPAS
jgi:hypothetical protein